MNQSAFWLLASLLVVSAALYRAMRALRHLRTEVAMEQSRARDSQALFQATTMALAQAIDARRGTPNAHVPRVQAYAIGIATALGLSTEDVDAVGIAALLRDVGKLAVPDYILAKSGPLTPEEAQKFLVHPEKGAAVLEVVPFRQPIAAMIRHHHERWDGRGYPSGTKADETPLGARIISLAEFIDLRMSDQTGDRSPDAVMSLVARESGGAFDPTVVSAFLAHGQALMAAQQDAEPVEPRPTGEAVFEDIALARQETQALYEIAQTMGASLGVVDSMSLIAAKLSNLVPFSACALFLYNEADETLYCRFAIGVDAELIQQLVIRNGHGMTGWVARNRRSLVNARPSADVQSAGANVATVLQSALVCPLISGERFIGALSLYQTLPSFYQDEHRRLLEHVCQQTAAVIHNAAIFERTQEASLTDSLTGLPNTRFMFLHLSRELARAERLNTEVSLLVMDLNDFKDINDTYGHHIGDRALREIAQVLRAGIRPYDLCVRYAGDEFIVVLSGCHGDEAERKRIELRAAVDRLFFEARPGRRVPLSISAGAAVYPHDGDTYEALLAAADSRMYVDKSERKRSRRHSAGTGAQPPDGGADTPGGR